MGKGLGYRQSSPQRGTRNAVAILSCGSYIIITMLSIPYSYAVSLNNINNPPRRAELALPRFVDLFRPEAFKSIQDKRWASVWMPCTFTHPSREAEYVSHMSAFVVDCDTLDESILQQHISRLVTSNHHFLVHSSHSYLPPTKAKVRFIFFLDELIPVGTQWRWSEAIWPRLTKHLGFEEDAADEACSDAARAFFTPIRKSKAHPVLFKYNEGQDLPTKTLLADIYSQPLDRYDFRREYECKEDPTKAVNLQDLYFRLIGNFSGKRSAYAKAVFRVLNADETPEGNRHQTIRLFTHALARVARPEEATEGLMAIMYPWLDKLGERANEEEVLRALRGAREKIPTWNAWQGARLARTLGCFDGR